MSKQMHFDDAYGAYFDFGYHTEKVYCSLMIWFDATPFFHAVFANFIAFVTCLTPIELIYWHIPNMSTHIL